MRKRVAILLVLILAAFSVSIVLRANCEGRTIVVPDDHPTIEAAIANANNGDTIFIRKGNYEGPLNQTIRINKAITFYGEDEYTTIINLNPPLVQKNIFTLYYMDYLSAIQINSDNVKITGLTVSTPGGGISAVGNEIRIVGINSATGISIDGSGAIISGNTLKGDLSVTGNNNTVASNLFQIGVTPPYFHFVGSNNVIINNKLSSANETSNIKVEIEGANNVVANNLLRAVYLKGDNNIIYKNSIKALPGDSGVYLSHSSGSTICGNRITYAESLTYEQVGVFISESHDNVVYANHIEGVFQGAYLQNTDKEPMITNNNTFYHNNFVNNEIQAWDTTSSSTNAFDKGEEGNYWSCYNGTDANNDGIGDTPYAPVSLYTYGGLVEKITRCSPDYYPLMNPFDIDNFSVELPVWVSALLNLSADPSPIPPATPTTAPTTTPTPSSVLLESDSFPLVPVAAASIAIVVVVGVGLLVHFKKRKHSVLFTFAFYVNNFYDETSRVLLW
jgi:nitrous oxidase accessory protein